MCKPQPETDNSESIQNNNLGLINLEASSMGGPGIFEIVSIILLVFMILLTCHYCNRRCKQNRRREMHSAVQEGMNANTVGYRAAGATGVPVITFEQPGSRSITMGQAAIPSAPMLQLPALPQGLSVAPSKTHVLPGLYEQCR